jgi:hypothetical protein
MSGGVVDGAISGILFVDMGALAHRNTIIATFFSLLGPFLYQLEHSHAEKNAACINGNTLGPTDC